MDVRELDIDLIDRINPFGEAYAILAKTMSEESLKQVAAVIAGQARQPHDRGGAGACQAGLEVQAGARPAALDHVARRLGKAHGRGRRLPGPHEGGGRAWLGSPKRMTRFSKSLASRSRRKKQASRTPREERIIAGFEEIQRFVEQHGRAPQHGEDRDIFERLYAVRLDRLRELDDCRALA